jgi:LuxR family maltose regulon positive regulatory protein
VSTKQNHQPYPALEKLDHGSQYKVVLIIAPSGFGKAKLIQQWSQLNKNISGIEPLCLNIESEDNHPIIFIDKLISEFTTWDPNIKDQRIFQDIHNQKLVDESALEIDPDSGLQPSIETLLNELINSLLHLAGDRFLIMLDYHQIENPTIHSMVAYLIDYLPPNLHLVITSQVIPPLQIPLLRARRKLLEIGHEDML